ncbi:hypothetical protein ACWGRV_18745 [Streptomyces sp. NPDC055663]
MRIRRAVATTAVGTVLALGVSAWPARAAPSDTITAATVGSNRVVQEGAGLAAGVAHYWATYNTLTDCTVAGIRVLQSNPSRYYRAECTPSGTQFKLWIWF